MEQTLLFEINPDPVQPLISFIPCPFLNLTGDLMTCLFFRFAKDPNSLFANDMPD